MTNRDLQSAREWAKRIVFGDEPPAEERMAGAILSYFRDEELLLPEELVDAATLLLCDPETLPPHSEYVIEEYSREQLRREICEFAEQCWNTPSADRQARWDELHSRASGDLVLVALLDELRPLLNDPDLPEDFPESDAVLLRRARRAAALPGRLNAQARSELLEDDQFRRETIERLAASLPSTGRWVQRILVPKPDGRQRWRRRAKDVGDWVEKQIETDVATRLERILVGVMTAFVAIAFTTGVLYHILNALSGPEVQHYSPPATVQQYRPLLPQAVRRQDLRRALEIMRDHQESQRLSKEADAIADRPPPPPMAVPLADPADAR